MKSSIFRHVASFAVFPVIFSSGFSIAATTLSGDYSIVASGGGSGTEQGNLVVAGDISAAGGIDLGSTGGSSPLSALQISYHVSGALEKSAVFDLTETNGSFVWRDNFIGASSNLVRTKMTLDENNVLSIYNVGGDEASLELDGSQGRITLNGANSGIYSGANPVLSLDSEGNVAFGADRSFSILNGTASSSSLTGAFTVVGGIGAGKDSHFNGISIGRGQGGILSNTVVGAEALLDNTVGDHNSAFGYQSLSNNVTGIRNVAIGSGALWLNDSGSWNQAIGVHALASNVSGNMNSAIGAAALNANTIGNSNNAVGVDSLKKNTIGSYNDAFGVGALFSNLGGVGNAAFGNQAMFFNASGHYNTGLGKDALYLNTDGSFNAAVGHQSLVNTISGSENAALGYLAGKFNSTGSNNVMIGSNAGGLQSTGEGLESPERSIYIGSNSRGSSNADENAIVIGANAIGEGANTTVIGNSNTTKAKIFGALDSKKVEITADAPGNDALVVDGRTRLKGQVILDEPQGDISMGIYE